jgi:hypothetical protein
MNAYISCSCGPQDQTTDHLLFECEHLRKERNDLTTTILHTEVWPTSKPELIRNISKAILKFTNTILLDKLTNPKPNGDS